MKWQYTEGTVHYYVMITMWPFHRQKAIRNGNGVLMTGYDAT